MSVLRQNIPELFRGDEDALRFMLHIALLQGEKCGDHSLSLTMDYACAKIVWRLTDSADRYNVITSGTICAHTRDGMDAFPQLWHGFCSESFYIDLHFVTFL